MEGGKEKREEEGEVRRAGKEKGHGRQGERKKLGESD